MPKNVSEMTGQMYPQNTDARHCTCTRERAVTSPFTNLLQNVLAKPYIITSLFSSSVSYWIIQTCSYDIHLKAAPLRLFKLPDQT